MSRAIYVAVPVLLAFAGSASAEVPAALNTAVSALSADGVSALGLVGGAMLTLAGVAVLFKWAKASFFG